MEIAALLRSDRAEDWNRGIELAHQTLPILVPAPSATLQDFLRGLPNNWRKSYQCSLPEEYWTPERLPKVRAALAKAARLFAQANETGSGLYLWEAYSVFRRASLPVPEPVLRYFDHAADKFHGQILKPSEDRAYAEIARALFMDTKGRGTVFSRYQDPIDLLIVWKLYIAPKQKRHVMIAELAQQLNIDKRSARRRVAELEKKREFKAKQKGARPKTPTPGDLRPAKPHPDR